MVLVQATRGVNMPSDLFFVGLYGMEVRFLNGPSRVQLVWLYKFRRFGRRLQFRLRRNGLLLTKPIFTNSNGVLLARGFAQAAMKEDDEDEEELDIDQRRLPTDYDPANFYPTEHCSPPTDRVFRLFDLIAGLKLVEVAELGAIVMERKGMTVPPIVGVMKAEFDVLAS